MTSRAQTYITAFDRWGNRWVGTPYWIVRCDAAKRLASLPVDREPGRYQAGELIGKAYRDGEHYSSIQVALRKLTKGDRFALIARPDLAGSYRGMADQDTFVYERLYDGLLVYVDAKDDKASLGRLREPFRLFQYQTNEVRRQVNGIVAYGSQGQPIGALMPLYIATAPMYAAEARRAA